MTLGNTQNDHNQSLNLQLIIKMILIIVFIIVGVVAVLNYLFLHILAKPRINQVTEMAKATSIIVSELALNSFYDRDREHLNTALKDLLIETNSQSSGFLQASVILYPSGLYYASTNNNFTNRKVGLSLLKKIEANVLSGTVVTKLNYEVDQKTTPVLQFLRNIAIVQKGKEKRIATTQILFDYGKILSETRETLIQAGGIALIFSIAIIWLLFLPISVAHRKLLEAMNQASRRNFEYTLQSKSSDEIGLLFGAYNHLAKQLKTHFGRSSTAATTQISRDDTGQPPTAEQQSLRKAEITCLCARIPNLGTIIGKNSPEEIADYIREFLIPFDETVKTFGGQVVRVLGDKVYAFFEGINSIDNAIRAAIKINQNWRRFNHERKVLGRDSLNYGIGLHSAQGIAGSLSETNWSYTFFGPASSIAGFLSSCAHREQILVSSSMMDNTSGAFQHRTVEDLVPFGLPETEVFLEISSDVSSIESGDKMDYTTSFDVKTESSDMMIETLDAHETSLNPILNETSTGSSLRKTGDASIPDMLEETLKATPLQSLNPKDLNDRLPEESGTQDKKGATFRPEKPSEKSRSLWDQVDQIPGDKKR